MSPFCLPCGLVIQLGWREGGEGLGISLVPVLVHLSSCLFLVYDGIVFVHATKKSKAKAMEMCTKECLQEERAARFKSMSELCKRHE